MKKKLPSIVQNEVITRHRYVLRLFISGASPLSARAIENIKTILDQYLPNDHSLEIVDVRQQPDIATQEQLVVLPLLVRKAPLPERRLVGDLGDTNKVLNALGLI